VDFSPVVIPIVDAYRLGEAQRWEVCRMVHDAYAELGLYAEGLTAALVDALNVSQDQVHNYRYAWDMRTRAKTVPGRNLHPTHYSAMYRLQKRYTLTDAQCDDWLEWAQQENVTVEAMRAEVSNGHDEDPIKTWLRRTGKLYNALLRWYQDSESNRIPDSVRQAVKKALDAIAEQAARQ